MLDTRPKSFFLVKLKNALLGGVLKTGGTLLRVPTLRLLVFPESL